MFHLDSGSFDAKWMSNALIQAVILCGGSGTRLWPLSRADFLKQFIALADDMSLLEETLLQLSVLKGAAPPVCVAAKRHRFRLREALERGSGWRGSGARALAPQYRTGHCGGSSSRPCALLSLANSILASADRRHVFLSSISFIISVTNISFFTGLLTGRCALASSHLPLAGSQTSSAASASTITAMQSCLR